MRIYLVRHPPPVGVDGLCYGCLDVAVEEHAIGETADSVFAQLSSQVLESARIYSSPASRCMGLARRIAAPRESAPTEDLSEMNFGDWQGSRWDSIAREKIDAWAKDAWGYRPGDGESADMVATRWERWLHHVSQLEGDAVVAVTHAGVIRVALARSAGVNDSSALNVQVPYGSVYCLEFGK
jgi:alpha-ribazole phosphatase